MTTKPIAQDDAWILAQFFLGEFDNDSSGVAEWLDAEAGFAEEEDRDEFIERIRKAVK